MTPTIDVVRPPELTADDRGAWDALQESEPTLASPYFCRAFTSAVDAVRSDVRVAVLRDGGRGVGFFPFQRGRFGRGRPVGGPLSDYHGVIAAPGFAFEPAALLRGAGLKSFEFDHLPCAQDSFRRFWKATTESPVLDLSRGYEAYVAEQRAAGSKEVNGLGAKWRRFEREVKPLRFELHTTDARVVEAVRRWKSEQCRATGVIDVFTGRWAVELVERIVRTKEDGFEGALSALWAGDDLLAAHLGMRSRTVWHYWFPAYNHEFSRYSPGVLLLLEMAKAAPALGVRAIDFGKGEGEYKRRMANGAVAIAEGSVELPSLATTARRLRRDAERWVKQSPIAAPARVPGRLVTRLERWLRFR